VPAVPTAVEAVATAVQAVVSEFALAVQTCIDAVATRFQAIGELLASTVVGPVRAPIIAGFDAVAPLVQAILDTVAPAVQPVVDAIAQVASRGGSGSAQQQCSQNN
jgi:phage-related protein